MLTFSSIEGHLFTSEYSKAHFLVYSFKIGGKTKIIFNIVSRCVYYFIFAFILTEQ